MEETKLITFCEWLIKNNIIISENVDNRIWRTSCMGSKLYTTEELIEKFKNKEDLE